MGLRRKLRKQQLGQLERAQLVRSTVADELSDKLINTDSMWKGAQSLLSKLAGGGTALATGGNLPLALKISAGVNTLIEAGRNLSMNKINKDAEVLLNKYTDEYADISDIIRDVEGQIKADKTNTLGRMGSSLIDTASSYIAVDKSKSLMPTKTETPKIASGWPDTSSLSSGLQEKYLPSGPEVWRGTNIPKDLTSPEMEMGTDWLGRWKQNLANLFPKGEKTPQEHFKSNLLRSLQKSLNINPTARPTVHRGPNISSSRLSSNYLKGGGVVEKFKIKNILSELSNR